MNCTRVLCGLHSASLYLIRPLTINQNVMLVKGYPRAFLNETGEQNQLLVLNDLMMP